MSMSIDPRMVSSMLKLDWRPAETVTQRTAVGTSAGASFDSLLQQLLSSSTELPIARIRPVTELFSSGTSAPSVFAGVPAATASTAAPSDASSDSTALAPSWGRDRFDGLIDTAARTYGVDAALIKAVVDVESEFRLDAVSSAGAQGLMQLMPGTARGLGVTNPYDPVQNINGGTRYLSELLRKYDGNTLTALAAYNAGPGRVDRLGLHDDQAIQAGLSRLPEETRNYLGKVMDAYRQYDAS
ncbi:lytic transglycosylase domain-containing protein [Paenibacillus sp. IB182496]|uniref:Lytic transglycosylase domain-containing protein n=1 Tax=Paenibacillus sabuli TaxID=2772509 RepID=A0A927BRX8_9BACL|nr:lytic transglycosylase domain-containing protein [Paenibacillus sabuli]MBD2844429.1 lytic transglycosylase domain-containing protein [Paenibacillus sabuli]